MRTSDSFFRLAASRHGHELVLKDAALFTVSTGHPHRPTRDLDFLGFGDAAEDRLRAVFADVAQVPVPDDGVSFDAATIEVSPIREDQEYVESSRTSRNERFPSCSLTTSAWWSRRQAQGRPSWVDDVLAALESGRSPLLLTERRDHLEFFVERLQRAARNVVALHGGLSARERREALARLAEIPACEERLVVATGRYVGEGFDDPRLDTLVLALPVAWRGTVVQYAGRLHRKDTGKAEVRIHDYRDESVPVLVRMLEKRLRAYRAIGYHAEDAPTPKLATEHIVEYDEPYAVRY